MGDKFPGNSRKFAKHGTLYCENSIDPDGWNRFGLTKGEKKGDLQGGEMDPSPLVVVRGCQDRYSTPMVAAEKTRYSFNASVPGRSLA